MIPSADGIYSVGVLANVLQLLKLPDGTVKVLVEGKTRVKITDFVPNDRFFEARAPSCPRRRATRRRSRRWCAPWPRSSSATPRSRRTSPKRRWPPWPKPANPRGWPTLWPGIWASRWPQKQELLETLDVAERLEKVYGHMQGEMSVLQVEKKIKTRVKTQMEKTQREYYLNEQMKAIQKELGDGEDGQNEVAELEERIAQDRSSRKRPAKRPRPS